MKTNLKVPAIMAVVAMFISFFCIVPVVAPVNALAVEDQNTAATTTEAPETLRTETIPSKEDGDVEIIVEKTEPAEETTPVVEQEVEVPTTIEPVETEPEVTEPPATEPPVHQEEEHHEDCCDHFWRQEYQPETETEDGRIYESCLYCGEYRLIQVIPAYGTN